MIIKKADVVSEVAALKFTTNRFDLWKKTNLLREPLFLQSLLIISFYGIGNAILQLLYKTNHISLTVKDSLFPFLYLSPLIGGLIIAGGFNNRRAVLSFIFTFMYAIFIFTVNKYFYGIHSLLEIFQFIPGCWLIIWWIITRPELMNKFGLRKSNFVSDLLFASILVVFITAYAVHLFLVTGFKLEFMPVKMAAYFSGNIISCMFVSNYCYGVWNILKKRGATTFQSILALLAISSIITGPAILAYASLGLMNPAVAFGGFIWTMMLTLIVMHFTFNWLRNSLTATFLIAMVMLLLKMAGVT
ncbi:MAG TPA: hypothetical protein PLN69_07050 [bacterium]|nr:hypothetical protein [bacterium]